MLASRKVFCAAKECVGSFQMAYLGLQAISTFFMARSGAGSRMGVMQGTQVAALIRGSADLSRVISGEAARGGPVRVWEFRKHGGSRGLRDSTVSNWGALDSNVSRDFRAWRKCHWQNAENRGVGNALKHVFARNQEPDSGRKTWAPADRWRCTSDGQGCVPSVG